jgi:hypothetical protein
MMRKSLAPAAPATPLSTAEVLAALRQLAELANGRSPLEVHHDAATTDPGDDRIRMPPVRD